MGHYYLGEFETALKHVQKGLKMQKDMGISMNMSLQNYNMGMIHLGLGELKSAQSCAEKGGCPRGCQLYSFVAEQNRCNQQHCQ